jgi:predicted metal-binding protein
MNLTDIPREFFLSVPTTAVCDRRIRALCLRPYPNHPRGCPKFGRCQGCPPQVKPFEQEFQPTVRVAAVVFDFGLYLRRKRAEHPDWTDLALRNQRHWQGHVRAELRRNLVVAKSTDFGDDEVAIMNPEARGVNLTATCAQVGLILEWPPVTRVCEIALIGRPHP